MLWCSLFACAGGSSLSTQVCIAPLFCLDNISRMAFLGLGQQNAWHSKPVSVVHFKHMRRVTKYLECSILQIL